MSGSPLPFNALRIIEAVVRHKSYSWAARELDITHSAISQSVKRLESQLQLKLFQRVGNGMEPTDAAVNLAHAYANAEQELTRSLALVRAEADVPYARVN